MLYTVGEMAKLMGVAPSTLRYYDKEGLLPFVERSEGGIRVFKESDYEWLKVIECLKKTGMQLKDIRSFILMAMEGDSTTRRTRRGGTFNNIGEGFPVVNRNNFSPYRVSSSVAFRPSLYIK